MFALWKSPNFTVIRCAGSSENVRESISILIPSFQQLVKYKNLLFYRIAFVLQPSIHGWMHLGLSVLRRSYVLHAVFNAASHSHDAYLSFAPTALPMVNSDSKEKHAFRFTGLWNHSSMILMVIHSFSFHSTLWQGLMTKKEHVWYNKDALPGLLLEQNLYHASSLSLINENTRRCTHCTFTYLPHLWWSRYPWSFFWNRSPFKKYVLSKFSVQNCDWSISVESKARDPHHPISAEQQINYFEKCLVCL